MSYFNGTRALALGQLKMYRPVVWWAGLVPGLAIGGVFALGSGDPATLLIVVQIAFVVAGALGPVVAAMGVSLPTNASASNSGYQRREALLALPIGRWAVPGAVFAGSAVFSLVWLLLFLLPLALTAGAGGMVAAVTTASAGSLLGTLAGGGFLWLLSTSLSAIGANAASSILLWCAPVGAVVALLPIMGYSGNEQAIFLSVCAALLGVCYLALPFLLYSRPRHLWFSPKKDLVGKWESLSIMSAMLGLALFGMGGSLWLAGGLALFALPTWRAWRRAPTVERPRWSHRRLANVVCLAALTPAFLAGAVIDWMRVSETDQLDQCLVVRSALSPDGRHLALEVTPRRGVGRISRIHLIDLQGEREPVVFSPRYAQLSVDHTEQLACWSSDGRYLAFDDLSLGRLEYAAPATGRMIALYGSMPWERVMGGLFQSTADTLLYDTHTGEIQEEDGLLLATGWTRPEELVELSVDLRGRFVLTDGTGRSAVVEDGFGVGDVVRYGGGGALVSSPRSDETGRSRFLVLPRTGNAFTPLPLQRLTGDGFESWEPGQDGAWAIEVRQPAPPAGEAPKASHFSYVFRSGERSVPLESGHSYQLMTVSPSGRALLATASRIDELDLNTGTRRVLLSVPEGDATLEAHRLFRGGVFCRRGAEGRWVWVTAEAVVELPQWVEEPQGWLPTGELLAVDHASQLVVGEPTDGAADRRLVRELALAR